VRWLTSLKNDSKVIDNLFYPGSRSPSRIINKFHEGNVSNDSLSKRFCLDTVFYQLEFLKGNRDLSAYFLQFIFLEVIFALLMRTDKLSKLLRTSQLVHASNKPFS